MHRSINYVSRAPELYTPLCGSRSITPSRVALFFHVLFWFRWPTKFFWFGFSRADFWNSCLLIQLVRSYDLLIGTSVIIRGKRETGIALRTSPLLLDNVKLHVIYLYVAGMLNIHGKRLNIWINMHILCWQSHMAKKSNKNIFLLCFLALSLCP